MGQPFRAESTAARAAQSAWATAPVPARLKVVREFRARLVEQRRDLLDAVEADCRRRPDEVLATDLLPTASACRFLLDNAARLLKPRRAEGPPAWLFGCRDTVYRRPRGVVGLIGTWNYPVFLNAVPIVQAITAGNAVLWKPSELAERSSTVIARLLAESGLPPDLVQRLPATREAGPQLAEADIDYVHFTGSEPVGRALAQRLGARLVPSSLELSGCDACIVRPDANLSLAAKSAWYGVTLNAGQTCLATRRIFVPRALAAEFAALMRPLVEASRPATLATPGQHSAADLAVAEAVALDLPLLQSPPGEPGTFRPTLILDAPPTLAVCREALFAPLAAVLSYADDADLLAQLQLSPFGLGAAVFTADPAGAARLVAALPAGHVSINDVIVPTAHPATPFGGRSASGWGVTQGAEGLLELTLPQTVSVRRGTFRPHLDAGLTPTPADGAMVEALLLLGHGRGWRARWRGVRMAVGAGKRLTTEVSPLPTR